MNQVVRTWIGNPGTPELEVLLDWQVVACGNHGTAEKLLEQRDRHKGQVGTFGRQVLDGRMQRSEAERRSWISAWLTVRSAVALIVTDALVRAQLDKLCAEYEGKRDGKELRIQDVNLDALREEVIKGQEVKLREICDLVYLHEDLGS